METSKTLRLFLVVIFLTGISKLQAQNDFFKKNFTIEQNEKCGSDNHLFVVARKKNKATYELLRDGAGSDEMICGRFKLIFMDVSLHDKNGFDDPNEGTARQQTACNVANYIQSIIYIPPGDGSYIEILFEQSWYPEGPSPIDSNMLALGGPFQPSSFTNGIDGIYDGETYDHIITGVDPDPVNYDGLIEVNFNYSFQNDFTKGNSRCLFDLNSILIHEMTHVLGWISLIEPDSITHIPISIMNPAKQYSLYDKRSLYHGDEVTGNFTQVLDSNTLTIQTGAWSLNDIHLWLTEGIAPYNAPLLAQDTVNFGTHPGSSPSHIDSWQYTYQLIGRNAPGYQPDFVMGAFKWTTRKTRSYTHQELRMLRKLGYTFNNSFLADSTLNSDFSNNEILNNHYPYTRKTVNCTWNNQEYPDDTILTPNDFITDNCHPIIIDLLRDTSLSDPDGDTIRVYPGSLFNIRGCGEGNNHNRLQLSPDGTKITFNPRLDFTGRAQFGFHLYDGKERGGFMVYTIEVAKKETCFNRGTNIIMNGDFEEGTEVKTYDHFDCENSFIVYPYEGLYYNGNQFTDAVYFSNVPSNIRSSYYSCQVNNITDPDESYGWVTFGFDSLNQSRLDNSNTFPVNNAGNRYLNCFYDSYFTLSDSLRQCHRYKLSFDINFDTWFPNADSATGIDTLLFSFSNEIKKPPLSPAVNQQVNFIIHSQRGDGWKHLETDFISVNNNTSKYAWLHEESENLKYLDNLQLIEIPFLDLGNDTTLCSGSTLTLHAPSDGVYSWNTGSSDSELVVDTSGTYSVFYASNGCSAHDSINALFYSPHNFSLGNDTMICIGSNLTLYAPSFASHFSWNTGSDSAQITISSTGYYSLTFKDSVCTLNDSIYVTVHTVSFGGLGPDTSLCAGDSLTLMLEDTSLHYYWSDGSQLSSIIINEGGTYSVIASDQYCSTSDTILVTKVSLPGFSLGNDTSLCPGNSLVLHAPTGVNNLWQDGSTGASYNVTNQGTYSLTISEWRCSKSDTININYYPILSTINIEQINDTLYCTPSDTSFSYGWFLNGQLLPENTSPELFINGNGTYSVEVIQNSSGCSSRSGDLQVEQNFILVYHDFTTDQILLIGKGEFKGLLKYKIYNCIGQLIFDSRNGESVENYFSIFIPSAGLAEGLYFAVIYLNDQVYKQKFLIDK